MIPTVDWMQSAKLEHRVASIISEQARYGVYFNLPIAFSLLNRINREILQIEQEVDSLLVPFAVQKGVTITKPFKKDGDLRKSVLDWGYTSSDVGGQFTRIEWVKPNLQSRQQVMDVLARYGWEPDSYTAKGNPRLTETSMRSVIGESGRKIATRFILNARRAQLLGLIKNTRSDQRIPSEAISNATPTGRMRHRKIVNIPKGNVTYGREFRELFTVPHGSVLVGTDAAGLELRCLASRMGDDEYIDQILNGDIHSYNQELAGLPTRDNAKTFIYALIYGAGDDKIGKIVGKGRTTGRNLRKKFLTELPKLGRLIDTVQRASKKGYLKGLDGRAIYVRSEHSALNSLIQSDGAILMKTALCYVDNAIKRRGLKAQVVITYHDEFQIESLLSDAEEVCTITESSICKAGSYFQTKCPLAGEAKVGRNWYETH